MTDTTPALDRATEAFSTHGGRVASGSERGTPGAYARAIVSAALTDPDDPDWIARALRDHAPCRDILGAISCECDQWPYDEADDETWDGHSRHQADAVRAAILGSES